jgi:hypothetical protein
MKESNLNIENAYHQMLDDYATNPEWNIGSIAYGYAAFCELVKDEETK